MFVSTGSDGVKLIDDLVKSLACALFNSPYTGAVASWSGLYTTLIMSGQACIVSVMTLAIFLHVESLCYLATHVCGTVGSACHGMYVGTRHV